MACHVRYSNSSLVFLPLAILMCLFPVIRYDRGYSRSQEFYESFWRIIKLRGLQLCLGNSLDLHLSQK